MAEIATDRQDQLGLRRLSTGKTLIAPSILASDFARLGEEIGRLKAARADIVHVDIMDAHFVPNLSIGPPVVKAARPCTDLPFDVHLMMTDPADYVAPFIAAGANHITFHTEANSPVRETIDAIHARGCSAGLCLKPATPPEAVRPYLPVIDLVLVMTVEPGFGGQSFMADMMPKVRTIRRWIEAGGHAVHLEVDGGINADTAVAARQAGANVLVAGTSVFRAAAGAAAAIAALRG